MAAAEKLARLLELADQGPVMRAALATEVAELLADWPTDYPDDMKAVCAALLAKAAREVDAATRALLRMRLRADPALAHRVLGPCPSQSRALVEAARLDGPQKALAERLGLDAGTTRRILDDDTGAALARACKDAGLDRAAFSALAILSHPGRNPIRAFAALDAFDAMPAGQAVRMEQGRQSAA